MELGGEGVGGHEPVGAGQVLVPAVGVVLLVEVDVERGGGRAADRVQAGEDGRPVWLRRQQRPDLGSHRRILARCCR